jgi:diguanylate cyclase (GGDEF)-like protein
VAGPALRARVAMQLRLHRTAQCLARLAHRDAVTGLTNRPQFDDELGQELKRARRSGRPLALLLAGLHDLAGYAQRHGQGAADNALRHVAGLAQQALQRPGDLAARHGPDTFALLLPDTTAAGAAALASRLQQSLADSGDTPAPGVWVGIGIGDGDLDAAAQAALAAARASGGLHLSATRAGGGHEPPLAV